MRTFFKKLAVCGKTTFPYFFAFAFIIAFVHYDSIVWGAQRFSGSKPCVLNVISICFDALVLSLPMVLANGTRAYRWIGGSVAAIWGTYCMAGVLYKRFYHEYFNITLCGETGNLNGLGDSIFGLVMWHDVLVVAVFCFLVIFALRENRPFPVSKKILVPSLLCVVVLCWLVPICNRMINKGYNFTGAIFREYGVGRENVAYPQGLLSLAFMDMYSFNQTRDVTDEDRIEMERYERFAHMQTATTYDDVIFVIVESFVSDAIEASFPDGSPVAPCLKSLVENDSTLYVPKIESKEKSGMSSDGQFCLMTGLLPHSTNVTVLSYMENRLAGLGTLLKAKGYNTTMVIPTSKTLWRQAEACKAYGIDNTVDNEDGWCDDEVIFSRSKDVLLSAPTEKHFLTILTTNMHFPYRRQGFYGKSSYTDETLGYLEKVNSTDKSLGNFLAWLKSVGKYDNTLIVIAADHKVPVSCKGVDLSTNTPLIILNSHIRKEQMPDSEKQYYQQDIFPTICDLMNIELPSGWRGVGYSIFSDSTERTMSQKEQQRLSDVILETNWFEILNLTN